MDVRGVALELGVWARYYDYDYNHDYDYLLVFLLRLRLLLLLLLLLLVLLVPHLVRACVRLAGGAQPVRLQQETGIG